ncbi:hypothetical protein M3Y99_00985700 [Aphelenchoides fujianensis]|nr:hypothetical protein M3Y99_00985700 [Aphelenchoides fujianensis]
MQNGYAHPPSSSNTTAAAMANRNGEIRVEKNANVEQKGELFATLWAVQTATRPETPVVGVMMQDNDPKNRYMNSFQPTDRTKMGNFCMEKYLRQLDQQSREDMPSYPFAAITDDEDDAEEPAGGRQLPPHQQNGLYGGQQPYGKQSEEW